MKSYSIFFAAALAVLLGTAPALADDKQRCGDAYVEAQQARRQMQLLSARKHLVSCLDPQCPNALQGDCSRWLEEVDAALPSVVIVAVQSDGRETDRARLFVDGLLLKERLTGAAIAVDPGTRMFRIELDGAVVERRVLIYEGQKNRLLRLQLPSRSEAAPFAPPAADTRAPEKASSSWPVVPLVITGTGLTAMIGGTILLAIGESKQSEADERCPTKGSCVDQGAAALGNTGQAQSSWGTVLLLGGGALTAGGGIAFLATRRTGDSAATVSVIPAANGVVLRGLF